MIGISGDMKNFIFIIGMVFFSISNTVQSSSVTRGEFEATGPMWPHWIRLSGPVVSNVDGEKNKTEITGGYNLGSWFVFNSSDQLFPDFTPFKVDGLIYIVRTGKDINLKGAGTIVDEDNDEMFMIIRRNDGTSEKGGAGMVVITGGTGKYVGIKGKCPYDLKFPQPGYGDLFFRCRWVKKS